MERYFLAAVGCPWSEVTKEQWVQAERGAGFRNTMGKPDEPGTGGFSNGSVSGRIVNMDYYNPEHYDDAFNALIGVEKKLYIEHEGHDEEDGTAYFGPFGKDEIDARLNGPYADCMAQSGNIECVEMTDAEAAKIFVNTRDWWMEQEAEYS